MRLIKGTNDQHPPFHHLLRVKLVFAIKQPGRLAEAHHDIVTGVNWIKTRVILLNDLQARQRSKVIALPKTEGETH